MHTRSRIGGYVVAAWLARAAPVFRPTGPGTDLGKGAR
jgi:hypothetical protein